MELIVQSHHSISKEKLHMYDTNIVYLPNIEQNELDTSYSNLVKYYSPWIVSHTIISIDMYYAYARQPKKWPLQWQAYMKKKLILHNEKRHK